MYPHSASAEATAADVRVGAEGPGRGRTAPPVEVARQGCARRLTPQPHPTSRGVEAATAPKSSGGAAAAARHASVRLCPLAAGVLQVLNTIISNGRLDGRMSALYQ